MDKITIKQVAKANTLTFADIISDDDAALLKKQATTQRDCLFCLDSFLFEVGAFATMPLKKAIDKELKRFTRDELEERTCRLTGEDAGENTDVFPDDVEELMYEMFPDDYTFYLTIDGIAHDINGNRFVLIEYDSPGNLLRSVEIDTDGALLQTDDRTQYKDPLAAWLAALKNVVRDDLREVICMNRIINDLSVNSVFSSRKRVDAMERRRSLIKEVWSYYMKYQEKERNYNNKIINTKSNLLYTMDKKQLKQILSGATINVQGDFVMEKHVEHEVGNVETGGIGIHIVNSKEKEVDGDRNADKGTTPQLDTLPELNTPEAEALWHKVQYAGWVDEKRQPTIKLRTKVAKAILANIMAYKLGIPSPMYEPFEILWGEKDLLASYAAGNSNEKNKSLKDEIRKSLK